MDKTDALADTADVGFVEDVERSCSVQVAKKLKCEMLKQKLKLYGIIALIVIVIILIIVLSNKK